MNKLYENRIVMLILSLILAIILFLYVKTEYYNNNPAALFNNISETSTETVSGIPVYVQGNVDNYYISGLPDKVSVQLSGPSNIISQTLDSNKFRVVTQNLSSLGVGTHYIQLQIEDISSELQCQISPSTVQITISQLVTRSFPVEVNIRNPNNLASGSSIQGTSTNPETVTLSGSEDTLNRVSRVYVNVNLPENADSNYSQSARIITQDSSGNILNITSDPTEVTATVAISSSGKTVPIKVNAVNGRSDTDYALKIEGEDTVTLSGDASTLSTISQLSTDIDVSNITKETEQTVTLSKPSGVSGMSQSTITVKITPTKRNESSTSNTSSNTNSGSTASSSHIESGSQGSSSGS